MKRYSFNNISYVLAYQTELEKKHGVCFGCVFHNVEICPDLIDCAESFRIYKVDYKTMRKSKIKQLFDEKTE